MKVVIQFEAQLRQVAGTAHFDLDVPEGSSLLTALQQVAGSAGEALRDRLLAADDVLQTGILVFVNDHPVSPQAAHTHLLGADDSILLLPPISGG